MLAHVVLLTLRSDLERADRHALAASLKRAAREIPDVRAVRVGRRVVHGAGYEDRSTGTVDFVAILEFKDLAGLQAYLRHPAHEELAQRFSRSLSSALIYDFELEDLDGIAHFE
jgi:hypothetical protein